MANFIFIATSIDGFIATKNGGIDWLNDIPNPTNSDFGYSDFMEKIDALVMGRNTFEKVQSFGEWPYSKKVFVLSRSLKTIPEKLKNKVEIISGDLKSIVSKLNAKGYKNLYIDGGKVIQGFLAENLINEMVITKVPILLGDGIPLFTTLSNPIKFSKVEVKEYNNYLVQTRYIK